MIVDLSRCKTVHDVLCEIMDVGFNIDDAANSLEISEYCPSHNGCSDDCSRCWRSWLESEVNTIENTD